MPQNHLDVQREATWALSNLTSGGDTEQLRALVAAGGAAALAAVLAVSEKGTVEAALDALHTILKVHSRRSSFRRRDRDVLDRTASIPLVCIVQVNPLKVEAIFIILFWLRWTVFFTLMAALLPSAGY